MPPWRPTGANPYGIRSAGSGCKLHAMESVISALTRTQIKPLASQVQIKLRCHFALLISQYWKQRRVKDDNSILELLSF